MTLLDMLPSIGRAAPRRLDPAIWPVTTHSDEEGRLCIGDLPLSDIADEFHTPTYVIDETDFRFRARRYRKALRGVEVVYAGKSLLTTAVARWAREEGLGVDVCSAGELAVALAGGMDPARIIMHGNAKSPDELQEAVRAGVGRIVLDSCIEIAYLAGCARKRQPVLIRVTPDIDIHGHRAVTTGISDQKFGFTLAHDQAADAVKRVLAHPILDLIGLHCHIGSQVTDPALYGEAIHRMIAAMADIRAQHGVILTELNIGGGHAIPYISGDREFEIDDLAVVIEDALDEACAAEHFPRPTIVVEPGRAISGRAGVTLYRVCSVKTQPGGRTFVAVDGGMSDNPRVSLYGAQYTVTLANRHSMGPKQRVTVAGRHCEAGDEIARDIELPVDLHPGDLLAVACTGSYHHSMASNYNMVCRPLLVAVRDGRAHQLIRRETVADLMSRDCG
ncbi:diaminopimelate decarboxylase [Mycobacterium montefiorense]|uniref:Diaminopimelate decarboxylase n=1 Tax=Mycobacterium montefiorense TaxID=154654 RepID=A0AA37PTH5_9MYCO|nr:diaminopimelate decarboxylase [Mycobacterium montefiorense]GBG39334.1 diaminopimelate decarboxylase [Mycobacterium montefiorense]GKU37469.1 diaminopimelate decarboxylase [Mycobacterium montefiorense]GKU42324.1 diaminopimelate decarboxylase [Mycobacterium montefiorense]GKU44256.1 diaminopimelate decarboxylase [Mycobacterium montefiorense]GKU53249.1 diaminopimelate decarboxylase [Mycobacterium montefiorense]